MMLVVLYPFLPPFIQGWKYGTEGNDAVLSCWMDGYRLRRIVFFGVDDDTVLVVVMEGRETVLICTPPDAWIFFLEQSYISVKKLTR